MAMRALVTGGAGFIGSHLIDRLVSRGDQVTVLDNMSSGKLEFIQQHVDSGNITLINGDITDFDDVKKVMKDIDCVYHLAANPDIRLGTKITDTDLKQGTIATYNVLESMRIFGVKRIVFASSSGFLPFSTLPLQLPHFLWACLWPNHSDLHPYLLSWLCGLPS